MYRGTVITNTDLESASENVSNPNTVLTLVTDSTLTCPSTTPYLYSPSCSPLYLLCPALFLPLHRENETPLYSAMRPFSCLCPPFLLAYLVCITEFLTQLVILKTLSRHLHVGRAAVIYVAYA